MNICVYGASSNAISQKYIKAVEALGEEMGRRGHGLVFGGGASGAMGASARGCQRGGSPSILGIAPGFFRVDGVLFEECTEMIHTGTMRERKQILEDRSDAFVIAPGGIGTFDEFFEILTLKQLGRHNKPIVIYNVDGYYDLMLAMLRQTAKEDFMNESTMDLYAVLEDPHEVLDYIENYDEPMHEVSFFKKIDEGNDD